MFSILRSKTREGINRFFSLESGTVLLLASLVGPSSGFCAGPMASGETADRLGPPMVISYRIPFSGKQNFAPESSDRDASENTENLQAVLCETRSPDPNKVNFAIRNKLPRIGGWFSIRRFLQLLDEDATFERNLKKHKGDADLEFDLPSQIVLEVLPDVLPQAGLPKADYQGRDKAKLTESWKQWISAHESELEKLEPTGASVNFSPAACKNRKPAREPR